MNARLSGKWGEEISAEYLIKKGYKILALGYSCRMGEIDIIAQQNEYIVFVEVKTRKDDSHGSPREFVSSHKIGRIRTTAQLWLQEYETELQPRFDVIEVLAPEGKRSPIINHLEDVF